MFLRRKEKLKYAIFAIELNRAIARKLTSVKVESFIGLSNVLRILTLKGLIKGFETIDSNHFCIFFKFNIKTGLSVIRKIKLLTKTSLKNYKTLVELKKLHFHNKSFLVQLFVLSTREGLIVLDNNKLSTKLGGELIYQIN